MLAYQYQNDVFRGVIVNSEGGILRSHVGACYGGAFNDACLQVIRSAEATHYCVYINDALSNHFKNKERTQQFIDLIASTGLLRYTEVSFVDKTPVKDSAYNNKGGFLELKTDLSKSSAQEMFLVGTVMRKLATNPDVIMSFLRLHKWFGKTIDTSLLFVISNSLTFTKKSVYYGRGHNLVGSSLSYVTGKTFKDALIECDKYPTLKEKKESRNYSIGQQEFFGVFAFQRGRHLGCKYSKGIIESYLSEEGNSKWVDSKYYKRG